MTIPPITIDQVAIICPTKDRPDKVTQLLNSIAKSTVHPAQVLIADGGHNLKPITKAFEDRLNITCLYCPEAGQVLQRNFAHRHLAPAIRLVIHIDDDITVEKNGFSNMLDFWNDEHNKTGKPLGGAAFNLVDLPMHKNSIFRKIMFLETEPKGMITAGGSNTPLYPTHANVAVNWLLGGATVWRRDILDSYKHPMSFATRWATSEDVMFSYPLHTSHRLMVVESAVMYFNDAYNELNFRQGVFYGVSGVLMRYFFVCQHRELSTLAFLWMSLGIMLGQLYRAIMGGGYNPLGLFVGHLEGVTRVLFSLITTLPRGRKNAAMRLAMRLAERKR